MNEMKGTDTRKYLNLYLPKQTQQERWLSMYAQPKQTEAVKPPEAQTPKATGVLGQSVAVKPAATGAGTPYAVQPLGTEEPYTPASMRQNALGTGKTATLPSYGKREPPAMYRKDGYGTGVGSNAYGTSTPVRTIKTPEMYLKDSYKTETQTPAPSPLDEAQKRLNRLEEEMRAHYGDNYLDQNTDLWNEWERGDYHDYMNTYNTLKSRYDSLKMQADQQNSVTDGYADQAQERADAAVQAAQRQKRIDEQTESIANQLLRKYLPQNLKAQGLGGLGVSESAYLRADNDYRNRLADISTRYSTTVSDAYRSRDEIVADAQRSRDEQIAKYLQMYADEFDTQYNGLTQSKQLREEDRLAEQQRNYDALRQSVEDLQYAGDYTDPTGAGLLGEAELRQQMDALERQKKQGLLSQRDYDEILADLDYSRKYNAYGTSAATADDLRSVNWSVADGLVDQGIGAKLSGLLSGGGDLNMRKNANRDILAKTPAELREIGLTNFNQGDKQTARVQAIVNAALNGDLHDGSVVDLNYGNGQDLYLYYRGNFYKA